MVNVNLFVYKVLVPGTNVSIVLVLEFSRNPQRIVNDAENRSGLSQLHPLQSVWAELSVDVWHG